MKILGSLGGGRQILSVCPKLCFTSYSFLRDLKRESCRVTHSQCVSSSGQEREP